MIKEDYIMIGYYIVGYVLLAFITFVVIWPMLKVANDADEQMEELLRQKKAEDAEKLDK
jgi:large-conductance mechanosensitive channel